MEGGTRERPGKDAAHGARRTAWRIVLLLVAATLALQSYLLLTYSQDYRSQAQRPLHRFDGMVSGSAPKPFVARVLVPFVVRSVGGAIPAERSEALVGALRNLGFHVPLSVTSTKYRRIDPRQYALWIGLAVASLVLLGEGIHRFLRLHYTGSPWVFETAAAASLLLWPMLIAYGSFMIDAFTPTIVVWTVYMAVRGRWVAYGALLLLAAFHKETMVVIPLAVGYLYHPSIPIRRSLILTGSSVAAMVAIRAYLSLVAFGANDGDFVQFHLFGHNASLNMWRGFVPQLVLILVLIAALVVRDLAEKPRACKALAITVLPLLAMGIFSGYFDEIRQYAEGYPGVVCLAFPTLANAFGRELVRVHSSPRSR